MLLPLPPLTPLSHYDLTPIAWLLGAGALLALGPLLWVWRRHPRAGTARRLHALTVLTLFLTFDLTLFGTFTRLSDSGLGCPDWPGCYGNASPSGARHDIAMAQSAQPTGPVTPVKAWIEMTHRYLALGVGGLILSLAGATWYAHCRQRSRMAQPAGHATLNPWWPTASLAWVCLQGAFGAWTVTWRLHPAIVTAHLLGAMGLLSLLCIQAVLYRQTAMQRAPVAVPPGLRALMGWTCALLLGQIMLGGWVSANYAVLACTEFPTCQSFWWPPMNFRQGFDLWRGLGVTADGAPIEFAALTAIHYTHRLMAGVVFVAIGLLVWRLRAIPKLRPQAYWLGGLALLQGATGLGNILLGWPLAAALLHTGGAAALALTITWTVCASRRRHLYAAARTDLPRRVPT